MNRQHTTVKYLCNILSPFQNIQIGDSKTGKGLTYISYLADSGCEAVTVYGDYYVYGISPQIDKDGEPFLMILIELKV